MADGKWIHDLKQSTPVDDAARRVLMVRLEVIRDVLPLAWHEADKDPEHVHQLRVGTRRARAALDIFSCCLPKKVYEKSQKTLKNIRRVAGEARDWDVFLASLAEWGRQQKGRIRPGIDCLVGYALAQRETAQAQLQQAIQDFPFSFDRFLAETVAAVHKPRDPQLQTLLNLARSLLTRLLQELDQSAECDLQDYKNLHQVRIAGKHLRYAMEIFADCFSATFREQLYPGIEEMQEILGKANDSFVACHRLEALSNHLQSQCPADWKRFKPGIEMLLHYHQARLPDERRRFQDWWSRWYQPAAKPALISLLTTSSEIAERISERKNKH